MATSTRWKYLVVRVKASIRGMLGGMGVSDENLQAELDQQGALGWELVQIIKEPTFCRLVFKRPM
jgi:hypothetical protein